MEILWQTMKEIEKSIFSIENHDLILSSIYDVVDFQQLNLVLFVIKQEQID